MGVPNVKSKRFHEDPRINNRCNGYVRAVWIAICRVTLLPRPRTFGFAGVARMVRVLGPLMLRIS